MWELEISLHQRFREKIRFNQPSSDHKQARIQRVLFFSVSLKAGNYISSNAEAHRERESLPRVGG